MGYFSFLRLNGPWLSAAMLLTFSSSYGQTFFISVFAGEIRSEFSLSHGAWGGYYTIGTIVSALVMVWAGMLADRYRVRVLAPIVLIILACGCISMATATQAWMLVPIIFLLRFAGQGMMSHIGMVATSRWFVASRGRALSIASMGFSLGNAFLPIVFVALLGFTNWRNLWLIAAALALTAIPVLWGLLRTERTPQSISGGSDSAGMDHLHWTRKMVLRHWLFWLMLPGLLGPPAWSTSFFFQQVHLTTVKGWSHLEFVAIFPLYTAIMIATTVAVGPAIDRFGSNRIMPAYLFPFALAFLVLGFSNSLTGATIGLAIMGVGAGLGNTIVSAFWAEHFGTRHIGSVKSMTAAVMVFGSAIGPSITGVLIDRGFDFSTQMVWIGIYFVAAGFLTVFACRRAKPSLFVST